MNGARKDGRERRLNQKMVSRSREIAMKRRSGAEFTTEDNFQKY